MIILKINFINSVGKVPKKKKNSGKAGAWPGRLGVAAGIYWLWKGKILGGHKLLLLEME